MLNNEIVHLLGNGLSVRHFESDLFHDEPTDGIRVSCNLGHPHLNCAWTFIMSTPLFYLCENLIHFTTPIVVYDSVLYKTRANTVNPAHLKTFTIHKVLHGEDKLTNATSGHGAAWISARMYNPKVLHLWGLDYLWTKSIESINDNLVSHKAINYHHWWTFWCKIFDTFPKTQFVIHTPTPIENLPKNVVTERV